MLYLDKNFQTLLRNFETFSLSIWFLRSVPMRLCYFIWSKSGFGTFFVSLRVFLNSVYQMKFRQSVVACLKKLNFIEYWAGRRFLSFRDCYLHLTILVTWLFQLLDYSTYLKCQMSTLLLAVGSASAWQTRGCGLETVLMRNIFGGKYPCA